MELTQIFIRLAVAVVCAGLATVIVPRKIPGKVFGLFILGIAGVFFGEWAFNLMQQRFGVDHAALHWGIEGVAIIPAVLGSAVLLYIVTLLLKWGKYE
jgi:uncharacterized membrane protein YeaQ/YmgE (transglycosylase-associated protein family)